MSKKGGKWTDPTVPNSGWRCTHVEDLVLIDFTCQMCQLKQIRFVHYMSHPDYPEVVRAGCVCAGKMSGDPQGAVNREKTFMRRERWANRKWRKSLRGNAYVNTGGFNIVIYQDGADWVVRAKSDRWPSSEAKFIRSLPNESEAKMAGFDLLQSLRSSQ